jgi:polysaccharide biosynthesis protein PslG
MKRFFARFMLVAAILPGLTQAGLCQSPPEGWSLPIPGYFGVNIHFKDVWVRAKYKDDDLGQEVIALKNAGIGWVRRDMRWSDVEPEAGKYDFSLYDQLVGALHGAGFRILLTLDYSNKNYENNAAPSTDQGRAAFARFAATAALRYAGKVDVWEIYNEPNSPFWTPAPDADQYVLLANQATAAIRKAVPGAVIVGPALAGPTSDDAPLAEKGARVTFLDKVLASEAAHQWNGITVHPYRSYQRGPESFGPQLEMIREMMRRHGIDPAKTPVITGEWGYTSWERGVDERSQAAYAVRSYLWAGIERMPFTIWYDWQDDGTDPNPEGHFGFLRIGPLGTGGASAAESKPAYNAVRQLSSLLRGYRFDRLVQQSSSLIVAQYVNGQATAYAAWSLDDSDHSVSFPLTGGTPGGRWQANNLLGKTTEISGHNAVLQVTKLPVIVRQKFQ